MMDAASGRERRRFDFGLGACLELELSLQHWRVALEGKGHCFHEGQPELLKKKNNQILIVF